MIHHKKERLVLWVAKGMGITGRALKASLAEALPHKRILMIRSESKRFMPRTTDIIINWGNSNPPGFYDSPIDWQKHFNDTDAINIAVNKLKCFEALEGPCNVPNWTTDPHQAGLWWSSGHKVIARYKLTSHGGKGIFLFDEETPSPLVLPSAPLYTRYKKKKHEYRVHVFNGEVIDICMKRKRRDWPEEINTKIRNMDGGWIFAREDIFIPDDLREQAIRAVAALGLDFGAVDIIWNKGEMKSYVLEVNTAPGLIGTSLTRYTQAIKEAL